MDFGITRGLTNEITNSQQNNYHHPSDYCVTTTLHVSNHQLQQVQDTTQSPTKS